jgi:cellulose synthase/poly-beta-1,6-N-acetylglucosamine synthase-like glycosyltransferase
MSASGANEPATPASPARAPRISLVIPCYNDEESVDELGNAVGAVLDRHQLDAEIILIDDGSRDKTWRSWWPTWAASRACA